MFQCKTRGKAKTSVPAQDCQAGGNCLLLKLFVLFRSLTEWLRPTHIGEDNVHDSVYSEPHLEALSKAPFLNDVWTYTWTPHSQLRLKHKINHNSIFLPQFKIISQSFMTTWFLSQNSTYILPLVKMKCLNSSIKISVVLVERKTLLKILTKIFVNFHVCYYLLVLWSWVN